MSTEKKSFILRSFDLVITVSVGFCSLENNGKLLEEITRESAVRVLYPVVQGKRNSEATGDIASGLCILFIIIACLDLNTAQSGL